MLPQPLWFAIHEITLINASIREFLKSMSASAISLPLTLVNSLSDYHDAHSMSLPIYYFSVISAISILFEAQVRRLPKFLHGDKR